MLPKKLPKSLIVAAIVLVILALGITSYVLLQSGSEEDGSASITTVYTGHEKVFVADLYEYVSLETKESIELGLYTNIDIDQPDLYTGTVRDASFTENVLASGQTESSLLIDIQPIGVTYEIVLFSDPRGGRPSVNIECAPQEEQLDPSIECKDVHHHE